MEGVFFDHMPFLILISEDPPRDESDERNSLKKERTTERIVDHRTTVDPDVMEYIYSSKYKANFKCFLEDKGISHFEWEPGAVLAYFECHEQKRDENTCCTQKLMGKIKTTTCDHKRK